MTDSKCELHLRLSEVVSERVFNRRYTSTQSPLK